MKRNKAKNERARLMRALKTGDVEQARVNDCGECTFCCTAPAIEDSVLSADEAKLIGGAKASCVTCKHANNGCAIYDQRPTICRSYMCLFAIGQFTLRPDFARVAWTLQPTDDREVRPVLLMGHCIDVDEVLTIAENLAMIESALLNDMIAFVVLRSDKEAWCFSRGGIVHKIKIDQHDPVKMRVLPHTESVARFKMLDEDEAKKNGIR